MHLGVRRARAMMLVLLAGCAASVPTTTVGDADAAGAWTGALAQQSSQQFNLTQSGATVGGTGTITVPPIAPISGPATPAYSGDNFTITSGTFTNPTLTFAASLGSNPVGDGTFYHGTLSFSGALTSATSMTGTLTFTPPRTSSQTFAAQTLTNVTLTRR